MRRIIFLASCVLATLSGEAFAQTPAGTCDLADPRCLQDLQKLLDPLGPRPQITWVAGVPMVPVPKGTPMDGESLYSEAVKSVLLVVARDINSQGSAVAVSPIDAITNCHVVMTGDEKSNDPMKAFARDARDILVMTSDRRSARAHVYNRHPDIDICFIRVDDLPLTAVRGIRPFQSLRHAERVEAIGNPDGLTFSYTEGVVSAPRPNEPLVNGAVGDAIQFSADTHHGSSGGALFDAAGNLIGITEGGLLDDKGATVAGINFAVAADLAWRRYGNVCDVNAASAGAGRGVANVLDCTQGRTR
jgi:S1-C subfamily serine protease